MKNVMNMSCAIIVQNTTNASRTFSLFILSSGDLFFRVGEPKFRSSGGECTKFFFKKGLKRLEKLGFSCQNFNFLKPNFQSGWALGEGGGGIKNPLVPITFFLKPAGMKPD